MTAVHVDTVLVRMAGHWGDELGGSGVFFSGKSSAPEDRGDPVDYPKETDFDNHYHDCDEYWILWAGRGTVVSEGKFYEVGPGDCVATGMGHHHDFPRDCRAGQGGVLRDHAPGREAARAPVEPCARPRAAADGSRVTPVD
ncbi:MAG: hypothetical protein M5R40_08270 [Anaerolineae bacterium]|nr:hypothetical protein [Anaerolineae bacterium]